MKKYKQLNEQQMQETKKKFGMLAEYSFITKPGDLLLDEDDETPGVPSPGSELPQEQSPTEEPQINTDEVTPQVEPEVPVEAPQIAPEMPVEPEGDEIEVDVTQLTQDQEEVSNIVNNLATQTNDLLGLVTQLIDKSEQNSARIETEFNNIKSEIEKRNPTPKEVMQKRNTLGNPFTETPEDYWAKKEAEGTYELSDNGQPQKEYELRASDLQDSPSNVYKSFGLSPEETEQSFKSVLGF